MSIRTFIEVKSEHILSHAVKLTRNAIEGTSNKFGINVSTLYSDEDLYLFLAEKRIEIEEAITNAMENDVSLFEGEFYR